MALRNVATRHLLLAVLVLVLGVGQLAHGTRTPLLPCPAGRNKVCSAWTATVCYLHNAELSALNHTPSELPSQEWGDNTRICFQPYKIPTSINSRSWSNRCNHNNVTLDGNDVHRVTGPDALCETLTVMHALR